ncbi:hypothetical protein PpBr36_07619 [Pyricularia pennisetigena]|uniref:hypothetical protein n=1 Tax=Pyricularia pennisetigena TaxID=1578925 RepID=UPI00115131A2|nr:hypothetical protein PpBr36_07619 [Pyricularia pennisetigena]TLS25659.1 hypothetical protein PpBr36_07619 [Pyricularia pennisetigena]
MPPRKQSTRNRAPPSDDEPEDLPMVAPDPKAIEIQTRLDERVEKIRADYLTKVEGVKKRAKGRLAVLSVKVNHIREKDLSRLVELLNQRQTTQSTIATKLTGLERELNSLRRYFEAGYNVVEKTAAELAAIGITHSDAREESRCNRSKATDVS